MEELAAQYPHVKFAEASSTVGYIQTSFDSSMEMLIEGAILAIIVVWLFLRDWRATLVSAVALPLSIIPTFWAIYMLGFTLNILTLLALTLVVGILVDDAIVEVENIVRHLRTGKPPRQAAMDAAIEIGLAVVATTLTICAVFIPVAFMSGIAGEFFAPFGFTVTVAVLFSLLVARTLTPMMAAYFLKPHDRPEKTPRIMTWYLGRVRWCLAHRWTTLGVATVVIFSMLALYPTLPTAFSPAGDNGFTTLVGGAAARASLEDTLAVTEQARAALGRVARGLERLHVDRVARRGQPLRRRRRGRIGAPRQPRDSNREQGRHSRRATGVRAQGDRDTARHTGREAAVPRQRRRRPSARSRSPATSRSVWRSPPRRSSASCARCRAWARSRAARRCRSPRS